MDALQFITIGRGTQNYTCASSTADNKPAQGPPNGGAVAELFDASDMARDDANFVKDITNLAAKNPPVVLKPSGQAPLNNDFNQIGFHFFNDEVVPVFDLGDKGIIFTKKNKQEFDPPADAGTNAFGDKAVKWLILDADPEKSRDITRVIRVVTAGGSAPDTCEGQDPTFTVQYSAQYWFFNSNA
jgi:hypothetical protein